MVALSSLVLTEGDLIALQFIFKYRYLSVSQVAAITGLKNKTISQKLLVLERKKYLGFFGNTGIRGYGKTPKIYYLKKKGYQLLLDQLDTTTEALGTFKEVNVNNRWSPLMYHRLATIDTIIALEVACQNSTAYQLPATFIEYRKEQHGKQWIKETADTFGEGEHAASIIPDAGFVLENTVTGKRALFLIEVDMGTETLVSNVSAATVQSFQFKLNQYDRYMVSGKFQKKYKSYGDFGFFILLTITTGEKRLHNMREKLRDLDSKFHPYYRFSTLQKVQENFFHGEWLSRDIEDVETYSLVRVGG